MKNLRQGASFFKKKAGKPACFAPLGRATSSRCIAGGDGHSN